MRSSLRGTLDEIDRRVADVLRRTRAAEQRGRSPGVTLLYERGRLEALRRDVAEAMRGYGVRASTVARSMIDDEADEALRWSARFLEAVGADHGAALNIAPFRPELVAQARANLAEGSPLSELFAKFGPDAAARVEAGIVQGAALGQSPDLIARRIHADVLETYTGRSRLIARTEAQRIVRGVAREAHRASPLIGGWRWLSSLDRTTCPACWAMHGTLHDVEEVLEGHPGCRCTMVPELASALARRDGARPGLEPGEERFAALPADAQRAILGPGKFEAYRRGEIRLADLAERIESPAWGGMIRERSLVGARRRPGLPTTGQRRPTLVDPSELVDLSEIEPESDPLGIARARRFGVVAEQVRGAMALAARVLRLPGDTPRVPLRVDPNMHLQGTSGSFRSSRGGEPVELMLSNAESLDDRRPSTVLHEFGHYLDAVAMPGGEPFASRAMTSSGLGDWYAAVMNSATPRRIFEAEIPDDMKDYLLSPHELWARSFAQWVATRAGDAGRAMRTDLASRPEQWDDADFAPIADAIDDYMGERGWLANPGD